ncbi:MFS transporter [Aureimonas populi]|uniref:MFS transporter n=1 Tax=Aureimonas populi TaxID=1701758 RepID=A0ABW5CQM3_9HYPH|nr:MFS transporter [Aureimonas populi]
MLKTSTPVPAPAARAAAIVLVLTYLGFVSLGLPDAAYGVAWPSLRAAFGLGQGAFGAGLVAVGAGFMVSSLSAGAALRRFGGGRLLAGSTLLAALGLAGFAVAPNWPVFLLAGLLVGIGGGAIDSGLNAYAAAHYSARQMNWLHAAFGLGAALGPLAMAWGVANTGWRYGYAAIGLSMGLLGLLFLFTRRLWGAAGPQATVEGDAPPLVTAWQALADKRVRLQVATFFVYVGVEIGAGQWAFAVLTQTRGFSVAAAGFWTGAFWFAIFLGRVVLGLGADRIGSGRLVEWGAVGALVSLGVFAMDPAGLGVAGLFAAGLALAPIFPMLMHRTPAAVGAGAASHAIGFQVSAAMAGGVVLPSLIGMLAARAGLLAVPWALFAICVFLVALTLAVVRQRAN